MAAGLMCAGKTLKGKMLLLNGVVARLFEAYEEGVVDLGKAKVGEKTFLDAFHPGAEALKNARSWYSSGSNFRASCRGSGTYGRYDSCSWKGGNQRRGLPYP